MLFSGIKCPHCGEAIRPSLPLATLEPNPYQMTNATRQSPQYADLARRMGEDSGGWVFRGFPEAAVAQPLDTLGPATTTKTRLIGADREIEGGIEILFCRDLE